jgi:hypothetical protein
MAGPLRMAILVSVLVLIAAIQVLPQVDLPDTAFHGGTAPILMKARAVSAPIFVVATQGALFISFPLLAVIVDEASAKAAHPFNRSLPILFSTFLC